jgi:hypothetical protein
MWVELSGPHLAGGEHLVFLLTVDEAMMVLHRDEWRELVCDGVVCECYSSNLTASNPRQTHFAWRGLRHTRGRR